MPIRYSAPPLTVSPQIENSRLGKEISNFRQNGWEKREAHWIIESCSPRWGPQVHELLSRISNRFVGRVRELVPMASSGKTWNLDAISRFPQFSRERVEIRGSLSWTILFISPRSTRNSWTVTSVKNRWKDMKDYIIFVSTFTGFVRQPSPDWKHRLQIDFYQRKSFAAKVHDLKRLSLIPSKWKKPFWRISWVCVPVRGCPSKQTQEERNLDELQVTPRSTQTILQLLTPELPGRDQGLLGTLELAVELPKLFCGSREFLDFTAEPQNCLTTDRTVGRSCCGLLCSCFLKTKVNSEWGRSKQNSSFVSCPRRSRNDFIVWWILTHTNNDGGNVLVTDFPQSDYLSINASLIHASHSQVS